MTSHRGRDGKQMTVRESDGKVLRFGLDDVAAQKRAKIWMDTVNGFFYECDIRFSSDFGFGEFKGGDSGNLSLASIKADAMSVYRTNSHTARDALDAYFILLPTADRIGLSQRGKEALVGPGEFSLVSTNNAYDYIQRHRTEVNNIVLPGSVVRKFVPNIDNIVAIAYGRNAIDKIFYSIASSLCLNLDSIHDQAKEILGLQVVELLGLVADGADENSNATPIRMAHHRRVLKLIDRDFKNPALSIEAISIHLKLSKRYLQEIAAAYNTTISRMVTTRRMANAKRLLAYRHISRIAISDIAYSSGFADVRYFNRVFKEETGLSPSHFMQCSERGPD